MFRKMMMAAALLAIAAPAFADSTPVLDRREHRQMVRIHEGWQNGQLTRSETARLVQGQARLRRMEHAAKADGVVTARERARLQQRADVQSRRIFRQRHDGQRRF